MKVTEEQLARMESEGAVVKRNPPNRPRDPEPEIEEAEHEEKEDVVRAVEAEALRMLVAQNSEVMKSISEALTKRGHDAWDCEFIRDENVEGDYKPLTHLRFRAVT